MKEKFEISKYTITAGLATPKRFAFISDTHNLSCEETLERIANENIEGILIAGDIIHDNEHYRQGIAFLSAAVNVAPTFCSIGNHELRYQGDVREMIRNAGAILLDDSDFWLDGIRLGGLTSVTTEIRHKQPPNLQWLTEFSQKDGYKVLLCHHPEYYPDFIRDLPINLILSGHAHGGQWRIFGWGAYAPGQGIFPKYTSGLYENRLLVCRGLANPHVIPRINNRPEVIILTLQ